MPSAYVLGLVGLVVVAAATAAPAAADEPTSGLFVTVAARECPTYTSISANLARNNIQESLKDLGANTAYTAGYAINPTTEASNQPKCKPITGWSFTLGTGIKGQAVHGPWGALSIVTTPFTDVHTTEASIPLLGLDAQPVTPAATLDGATTFELSADEAALATKSSSLWIQGGTPADPILDKTFPGQFGFGALRCAVDNLNGDNVEWIQFPAGTKHVFCYAYYVRPPPTSGTIIIRKQLVAGATETKAFGFVGNVSYNPGGTFSLSVVKGAPAQTTFYRAATTSADPWTAQETVPDGWRLTDLQCTGASPVTIDKPTAKVSIALLAGDTATCTFTDQLIPPPGQLLLSKITLGGLGAFRFSVKPDGASNVVATAAVTTKTEGTATPATPSSIPLNAGRYNVTETSPAPTDDGHWAPTAARCNGISLDPTAPVTVDILSAMGTVCTFTNTFIPRGSLSIGKVTFGATGTAGFVIEPVDAPQEQLLQDATTTDQGIEATATGDSSAHLDLGDYVIIENSPTTPADGEWTLDAVVCNGALKPFMVGRVKVALSADDPHVHCTFTDRFTPNPTPPTPQPPAPGPDPTPGADAQPDVVIGKSASEHTAVVDQLVDYAIPVHNRGRFTAQQVVVADLPDAGGEVVSARTAKGTCRREGRVTACQIGNLKPGQRTMVHVTMRVTTTGTTDNFAAAGSATPDLRLISNKAVARVRVRPAPASRRNPRRFVACPAGGPHAHAAC